jgi:predicted RNA binding protein YcfA (HicA-like mRNA interferase family)
VRFERARNVTDILERMRRNPAGDWTIADIRNVCRQHGIVFFSPTRGSHYKVSHPAIRDVLTIPYRRPIKPVYIRKLVKLIDAAERSK